MANVVAPDIQLKKRRLSESSFLLHLRGRFLQNIVYGSLNEGVIPSDAQLAEASITLPQAGELVSLKTGSGIANAVAALV